MTGVRAIAMRVGVNTMVGGGKVGGIEGVGFVLFWHVVAFARVGAQPVSVYCF